MDDRIGAEAFIETLRRAGVVPDGTCTVAIRAGADPDSADEFVSISYDATNPDDEDGWTLRSLNQADVDGLRRHFANPS